MEYLYVAWQDSKTREWVPVAKLTRIQTGYSLQYTRGAKRCPSFQGLGRMHELDGIYSSSELFPFFQNRLINKSRPEYKNYLRWLGLKDVTLDAMEILSITGGPRATDSFELIPSPRYEGTSLVLDFFPRGLNYFPKEFSDLISSLHENARLYLIKDVQNEHDKNAILLRTNDPKLLIGYMAKYYCSGLNKLLDGKIEVSVNIKRVNKDAPLDMRLLCTLTTPCESNFRLIENEDDFLPWTSNETAEASLGAIKKAAAALQSNFDGEPTQ